MTDKEYLVKTCEIDVRRQELKVREAKTAMEEGRKKLKAEFDAEVSKLQTAYESAFLDLEREQNFLERAKAEVARGYEA